MNDRESFLQAIRANPDDDHLRLIYADWLEERGDPRGEFIRVQIELMKPELDPERQKELVFRQEELIHAHRTEWLQPFNKLFSHVHFRRGFPFLAVINVDCFLEMADKLCRWEPIENLQLCGTREFLRELAQFRDPNAHPQEFAGLSFEAEELDDAAVATLASSPLLRSIKNLSLGRNRCAITGTRALASSPYLEHLVELDLSQNPIEDLGLQAVIASPNLSRLKRLRVSRCSIELTGARALARSPLLGQLELLDLSSNPIGDTGVRVLSGSAYLSGLTELNLADTGLSSIGIEAFAQSPHVCNLSKFDLSYNTISTRGGAALAKSTHLQNLRQLRLRGNHFDTPTRRMLQKVFGKGVIL
jgi:uncharacterized protein (TIGR02996 family)